MEAIGRRSEWFQSLLSQPWVVTVALASIALFVIALIWRRHRAIYAMAKGLYDGWHAAIPRYQRSITRLSAELERARRYGHSLTVVVLTVDYEQNNHNNHRDSSSLNADIASPFFLSLIGSLLRDNIRGCDLVTYDVTKDHYVLLFPESSTAMAEQTMARLRRLMAHRAKCMLRYGIAEYPAEGLILQDLVSRAHARSQRTACETTPQRDAAAVTSQGTQRTESLAK